MDYLEQSFSVHFDYKVYFTSGIFDVFNKDFENFLRERICSINYSKDSFCY